VDSFGLPTTPPPITTASNGSFRSCERNSSNPSRGDACITVYRYPAASILCLMPINRAAISTPSSGVSQGGARGKPICSTDAISFPVNDFRLEGGKQKRACVEDQDRVATDENQSGPWGGLATCRKAPLDYTHLVTRQRTAQIGITIEFLIVVRALGEIFRLRHFHSATFSTEVAMQYVGGALIAAYFCWLGVTLYFFQRYALSAWIALATVVILLAYKIVLIGW
jgi:hypothetical protein